MEPNDYIKDPCQEKWQNMTGTKQKKRCSKCSCDVHNLTGMSHEQMMELYEKLGGKLCGIFFEQTKPSVEQIPEQQQSKLSDISIRRVGLKRSVALGAGISTLALAACKEDKETTHIEKNTPPSAQVSENPTSSAEGDVNSEKEETESSEIVDKPAITIGKNIQAEDKNTLEKNIVKPDRIRNIKGKFCPPRHVPKK